MISVFSRVIGTLRKGASLGASWRSYRMVEIKLWFISIYRYLEKQDFLQRTDERQFETERRMREGIRKRWCVDMQCWTLQSSHTVFVTARQCIWSWTRIYGEPAKHCILWSKWFMFKKPKYRNWSLIAWGNLRKTRNAPFNDLVFPTNELNSERTVCFKLQVDVLCRTRSVKDVTKTVVDFFSWFS